MYNWAEICYELKGLKKRVDAKISRIVRSDPAPFHLTGFRKEGKSRRYPGPSGS